MSCPCGSIKCVCEEECYCHQVNCICSKCQYLEKLCSRCSLPFYVIIASKDDIERQVCCCVDQEFTFYTEGGQSDRQTSAAARGNQLSAAPVRRDKCPRCDLPVLIVTTAEDCERRVPYCCCSTRNPSTKDPDATTEHETSNCTSDHREVSADRQGRKVLSRKIRTKKSNWQVKKVKEHSSNSAEDCSNTETVNEDFPPETSCGRVRENQEQNVSLSNPLGDMSTEQNFNPNSNTQSPAGNNSKADESSTGNISLLVDTSGAPSPSASKFISLGFFQPNENVRPNFPHPFPRLPNPIPGPPAFFNKLGSLSHLQFKRWTSHQHHPFPIQQPAAARAVKMEKWFETIEEVLTTSGELPDAETAEALDKEDKQQLEKEAEDKSGDQPGEQQIEQRRYPLRSRQTQSQISRANYQNNGKDGDDNEPTTDTNRSTSLSKSHKESESD